MPKYYVVRVIIFIFFIIIMKLFRIKMVHHYFLTSISIINDSNEERNLDLNYFRLSFRSVDFFNVCAPTSNLKHPLSYSILPSDVSMDFLKLLVGIWNNKILNCEIIWQMYVNNKNIPSWAAVSAFAFNPKMLKSIGCNNLGYRKMKHPTIIATEP